MNEENNSMENEIKKIKEKFHREINSNEHDLLNDYSIYLNDMKELSEDAMANDKLEMLMHITQEFIESIRTASKYRQIFENWYKAMVLNILHKRYFFKILSTDKRLLLESNDKLLKKLQDSFGNKLLFSSVISEILRDYHCNNVTIPFLPSE